MNHTKPAYPIITKFTGSKVSYFGFGEYCPESEGGMTKLELMAAHTDIPWDSAVASLLEDGKKKPSVKEVMAKRAELRTMEARYVFAELEKA
jgi:hypothetical protein